MAEALEAADAADELLFSVVNEPAAVNLRRNAYVIVQTASRESEKGHAKGLVPPACPGIVSPCCAP